MRYKSQNISLVCSMLSVGIVLLSLISCNSKQKEQNQAIVELPYYHEATFMPEWFGTKEISSDFHKILPFSLENQLGETVTEKTVEGKIYVVNFFFTSCPGICPQMTSNMSLVQKEFLDDDQVLLLSHSVTPKLDSVSVLKEYAQEKGVVNGKWHLLTGSRDEIYDLGRNYYFVEEDLGLTKNPDDFIHTENFVLIDQNRHIRGIYNGLNKPAIEQLISDIKLLEDEKTIL